MVTEAKKRANAKWDRENRKMVGTLMNKKIVNQLDDYCRKNGTTKNALVSSFIKTLLKENGYEIED